MVHTRRRIGRTVILGLGQAGGRIVEGLARRLGDRLGSVPPPLALLVFRHARHQPLLPGVEEIVLSEGGAGGGEETPLPARAHALAALRQQAGTLQEAVVRTLDGLGRLKVLQESRRYGLAFDGTWPLRAYVAANLGETWAGAVFLEAAYLLRRLAARRSMETPMVSGILLLPDPLAEIASLADVYAALQELEHFMGAHDGYEAVCTGEHEGICWGPPFNDACYLLGHLNDAGLALEQDTAREGMVAEWLFQLTLTPLADAVSNPVANSWLSPCHAYSSFGLALWEWPAWKLRRRFGKRLRGAVLNELLRGQKSEPGRVEAEVAQGSAALSPSALLAHLQGGENGRVSLDAERPAGFHLGEPEALSREMEATRAGAEAALCHRIEAARGEMENVVEKMAREVRWRATRLLDNGGFAAACSFLDSLLPYLRRREEEARSLAAHHREAGERLNRQAGELAAELADLSARFPPFSPDSLLVLLRRPWRIISLALLYRRIVQVRDRYLAYLDSSLQRQAEGLAQEMLAELYGEALALAALQQEEIRDLQEALRRRCRDAVQKDDDEPLAEEPALSILTPAMVEGLYGELAGDPAEVAAAFLDTCGPLSRWLDGDLGTEELTALLDEHVEERFSCLEEVSLADYLLSHYSLPELRENLEALLAAARPFWPGDEALLAEEARSNLQVSVLLGLHERAIPVLQPLVPPQQRGVRFVSIRGAQRVIATVVKHGLPLFALPGLAECRAAYEAVEDGCGLHREDGPEVWPSLQVDDSGGEICGE